MRSLSVGRPPSAGHGMAGHHGRSTINIMKCSACHKIYTCMAEHCICEYVDCASLRLIVLRECSCGCFPSATAQDHNRGLCCGKHSINFSTTAAGKPAHEAQNKTPGPKHQNSNCGEYMTCTDKSSGTRPAGNGGIASASDCGHGCFSIALLERLAGLV